MTAIKRLLLVAKKIIMRVVLTGWAILFLHACRNSADNLSLLHISAWDSRKIHPGVTWRSHPFSNLFGSRQFINVLDIDLNDTGIRVFTAYQDSILLPTHVMAERAKALAAVNGNFFHTEKGGSVCFYKVNGKIIDTSRTDLDESLFLDELDDAAISISADGKIAIISCPNQGWNSLTGIPTIISGGPPLLLKGDTIKLIPHTFNDKRFGRTGAGLTKNNHLLLVTVDGNTAGSAGMTLREFRNVFQALQCIDAINLDGGGSATMWISGQPDSGIVNHPSDNKRFDHFGERKVANIIMVRAVDR